jgi:DNA-binding transcriptional LysR family regulator
LLERGFSVDQPRAITAPLASPDEETSPGRRLPQRLARTRRRVAVMVTIALVYAVGLFAAALTSPDRGFFTYQGSEVVVVDAGSPAAAAGLMVGDHIVAVDGVRIADDVTRAKAIADIGPDRTVTFTVSRRGELAELTFTMKRRLPLASAGGVALALVLLALALLADRGRSHDLPQQFLRSTVIYVVFLAGAFAVDVIVHRPLLMVPWLYAMVLAAPATCQFMLRFPNGRHYFTRREVWALYAPPLALATFLAVNYLSFWVGHPLPLRQKLTLWNGGACGAMAAAYLSYGAVSRARRLRAKRAEIDTVAAKWLHVGGVIMAVPLLVGTGAAIHNLKAFIAGGFGPYVAIAMVGGSACVVLAMTRVPFGELDRLWRRSSGYLLATLLAAGLYLVFIGLLGGAASTLSGGSFSAALGATLTAAVVFGPLRVKVQRIVEDRFARDRSRARRLLREAEDAVDAVQRHVQGRTGRVRLGTSTGVLVHLLPSVLEAMNQTHPDIDVEVTIIGTNDGLKRMAAGTLDVALVAPPEAAGDLVVTRWRGDPMMAFLPPGWEAPKRVTPQWLNGKPLIFNDANSRLYQQTMEWFGSAGIVPRVRIELNFNDAMKSLVAAGYGAAILPMEGPVAKHVARGIQAVPLKPALVRDTVIVHRAQPLLDGATRNLLKVLRSHGRSSAT